VIFCTRGGAVAPIGPVLVIAPGYLRKTVFVPWESAPIWGRYVGLKIGIFDVFWHYGVHFLGNWSSEFHQISTLDRLLIEPNPTTTHTTAIGIVPIEVFITV